LDELGGFFESDEVLDVDYQGIFGEDMGFVGKLLCCELLVECLEIS
jgi:hypothetical protein